MPDPAAKAPVPVVIDQVVKRFDATTVLKDISIDIPAGAFVVLVGPSGCGKSTLLRSIAGLESITGGEIRIAGRAVNRLSPRDRNVAMVFQNYALYPHMTVAENMGFSLKLAKVPAAVIAEKVRAAGEILGLTPLLARFPKQLSGGQRQRVAMGRAIVREPDVFLFDEPLSNLDAKLRVQMRTEIRALQQRLGTTTVYVTHDQIEAMTMADRIVILRDGRVMQAGAPLDLYDRPDSLFVAGFLGSPAMNFLTGSLVADGFRPEGGTGVLPLAGPVAAAAIGRPVIYGVRPEHLDPAGDGIAAEVQVVEPTGAETLLFCRLAGQALSLVLKERVTLAPGSRICLRPRSEAVHLFDPQTELRIDPREIAG